MILAHRLLISCNPIKSQTFRYIPILQVVIGERVDMAPNNLKLVQHLVVFQREWKILGGEEDDQN
jgi:hypothetical protein